MTDPFGDLPEHLRPVIRWGGPIDSCSVCLRIFGEDLDPDVVTKLLGAAPTKACRKGDVTELKVTTRVERRGKWLLGIDHQAGVNLETVVNELLDRLTDDLSVWRELTSRFQVDLYCGLRMEEWNRGLTLAPATLRRLAERGLQLGLDICYMGPDGSDEEAY